MAVGLGPENWALLALCGVFLGLVSSLLAIEPGFLLMPLLAILLPRLGVPTEATAPVAIATALALLVPVSIARLQPLPRAERRHVAWLSPAILAGAFFGASLVPLIPGPWLLAGFAVTAVIALLRRPPAHYPDARRDPAAKTSATLHRDLEKCGLLPVWDWLASFGRRGSRESGLDPDAGSRRNRSASQRTSRLPRLRGLRLHARSLCHRSRIRAHRASVAGLAWGETIPVTAASPCSLGGRVSASRSAHHDLGNPKEQRSPRSRPGSAGLRQRTGLAFKPLVTVIPSTSWPSNRVQGAGLQLCRRKHRHHHFLRWRETLKLIPLSHGHPAG